MECPNCKEKYKFSDVPAADRNMKLFATEFICPYCDIWLTPDKEFSIIQGCCSLFMFLAVALFFAGYVFDASAIVLRPGIVLFSFSIVLFIFGHLTMKVERV